MVSTEVLTNARVVAQNDNVARTANRLATPTAMSTSMGMSIDVEAVFLSWVEQFGAAFEAGDATQIATYFGADSYWRDILAFSAAFRCFAGPVEIQKALVATLGDVRPRNFRVADGRIAPRRIKRSARDLIEGYIDFDTRIGRGTAFVRLLIDQISPIGSRIWILLTTLQELRGFEEAIDSRRPTGHEYSTSFAGDNWLDQRRKAQEYSDRDPEVLIVGAGQSGLALGARLAQIGVDALIVEKSPRIGDNWRNRYHSLTLHNEVWANSLPYLPFPPNWPTFLPKDKLAGWLEAYAEFMELNVWTSCEFVAARPDQQGGRWAARVRRGSGEERELLVSHVVLATGSVSGVPNIPQLSGLDRFKGEVIHSSEFASGIPYAGKKALVVGTGTSGHDVAQDLFSNGAAEVTMMQRGSTCVVSLVPSGTLVYAVYSEGPSEDIDLITASIPYPVLRDTYRWLTRKTCELDRDLLERLTAVGFEIDLGPDDTGFHMKYLQEGGGYYINVGCSDLIADGKIKIVQARGLQAFTPAGVRLKDGTTLDLDLVVLATGYQNQQEGVRGLFGNDVADRVGPIWGFNNEGFLRNMWCRTAVPGFWLMGGALMECRLWSRFLALQIKADLEGIRGVTTEVSN